MRRPLKPFVTEYKGARRAALSFSEAPSFDAEPPSAKPTEVKQRSVQEPEDGYEAAMRAADALVAPAPRAVPPPSRPQTDAQPDTELAPSEPGRGRILRVVDEAPPPEFAALEAEFSPKRRGRKPGSKNKPKAPSGELNGLGASEAAAQMQARPDDNVEPQAVAMPAQLKIAALSTEAPTLRAEKRQPWLRERAKPGENWKRRRLPRVCW